MTVNISAEEVGKDFHVGVNRNYNLSLLPYEFGFLYYSQIK